MNDQKEYCEFLYTTQEHREIFDVSVQPVDLFVFRATDQRHRLSVKIVKE